MGTHIDPQLAEKIVHEVKSQGVFDEFRKDSIADVDTKPAYQNLRQRVENAVQKFLNEQKWTPETNKNQLREKLRRNIAESGFLDVGVERIVDQVVNPKIASVFQPRIEEIAYKFLGIAPPVQLKREQPPPPHLMPPLPPFPINGTALKVETERSSNLLPTDLEQVSPDSDRTEIKEEESNDVSNIELKADDDDESPPFEPLTECKSPIKSEQNGVAETKNPHTCEDIKNETKDEREDILSNGSEKKHTPSPIKDEVVSADGLASQESQLSQVSSDTRISTSSNQLNQSVNDASGPSENAAVNISEEAQMPKFSENSTETENNFKNVSELHFDIKKDEIKFEGTERKSNIMDSDQSESIRDAPVIEKTFITNGISQGSFHFTKLNVEVEPCNSTQEAASLLSSQNDTSSVQLRIVERSEHELPADTNSVQKGPFDETSAAVGNTQLAKQNDEKRDPVPPKPSTSSSSSSSRLKKLSYKDKYRSPDRKRRREDSGKDKDKSKYDDRYENRYSSKSGASSNDKHRSSSNRHSSLSKRNEKDLHRSSSSRSESRSRHDSSRRDYREKRERDKNHRTSSSNKDHKSNGNKPRITAPNDDHNESRDKLRWRKSTDSTDDDKSPGGNATAGAKAPTTKDKSSNRNGSSSSGNTKNNSNENKKQSKDVRQSDSNEKCKDENKGNVKGDESMGAHSTDILKKPSKELENDPSVERRNSKQGSEEYDKDLLYFDEVNGELKTRLDLLNDAIHRCRKGMKTDANDNNEISSDDSLLDLDNFDKIPDRLCFNDIVNEDKSLMVQETKATLLIDCYRLGNSSDQLSATECENIEEPSAKRSKLIKKYNTPDITSISTKENQMKEKNLIVSDNGPRKSMLSKRTDSASKLQQQRYTSEDLYKPRPVLGQRSKRRGDSVV